MLHLPVLMTQNTGDLHSCRYGETRAHSHRQNTCVGIIQRSQQLKLLYTNIVFNQQNEKGGKKNSRNCFKYKKNMWCEVVYFAPIHTQTPSNHLKVSVNWISALAYISAPATSQFFFQIFLSVVSFAHAMRVQFSPPTRTRFNRAFETYTKTDREERRAAPHQTNTNNNKTEKKKKRKNDEHRKLAHNRRSTLRTKFTFPFRGWAHLRDNQHRIVSHCNEQ